METKLEKTRRVKTEVQTMVRLLEGKMKHLSDAVTGRPLRTLGAVSLERWGGSHHKRSDG